MSSARRLLIIGGIGLALLGMAAGCNRPMAVPPDEAAAPEAAEVKVVRPQKKDVRRTIERPG